MGIKKKYIPTPFQRRVYNALLKIPRGKVTTYKILAQHSLVRHSPPRRDDGGCRAVGQALKRNPFAPKVPCHRVIASDLTPGGFSAAGGPVFCGKGKKTGAAIRRKLKLLEAEGVKFKDGRLVNPDLIYRFPDEEF